MIGNEIKFEDGKGANPCEPCYKTSGPGGNNFEIDKTEQNRLLQEWYRTGHWWEPRNWTELLLGILEEL